VTPPLAPGGRLAVSRRASGLGDCLGCLLAGWRYARATGRTLVVDWRGSPYALDRRRNAFPLFFEPPAALGGVPVVADDRVAGLPAPPRPPGWAAMTSEHREDVLRQAALARLRSGAEVAEPVVFLEGCLVDAAPEPATCRQLLDELRPVAGVREAVERFARAHFAGRRVVGVHVRHGNGGDVLGHAPYWADEDRALATVARAIDRARAELGGDPVVFLATDSRRVADRMAAAVPGLTVRAKHFRPDGQGELHRGPFRVAGAADALAEMLLLARADVLVRFPPGSYFALWASLARAAGPGARRPRAPTPVGEPLGAVIEW
jgi:hypothetical protein